MPGINDACCLFKDRPRCKDVLVRLVDRKENQAPAILQWLCVCVGGWGGGDNPSPVYPYKDVLESSTFRATTINPFWGPLVRATPQIHTFSQNKYKY